MVADLNRDGKLDLIVLNKSEILEEPSVLFGDGRGGFSHARRLTPGDAVGSIAVGRFNPDRGPDLAITREDDGDGHEAVRILLGARTGWFRRAGTYRAWQPPRSR